MGLGGRIAAAKYFQASPGGAGDAGGADTTFEYGSDEGRNKNTRKFSLPFIHRGPFFPPIRAPHSGSVLFPLKSPNLPLLLCSGLCFPARVG